MRIGIDARELTGRPTGVGRYLGALLTAWAAADPAGAGRHEWTLYSPLPIADEYQAAVNALGARVRLVPGGFGTRWEQVSLARAVSRDLLDVLFAPAYTAPLGIRCPVVLTIHDVSFVAHPEWFPPRERLRRTWITRRAAARARVVLTVSEFSRREILRLLAVPGDRLRVILHGRPRPMTGGRAVTEATDPLVLYVGSLFNRRRIPDMVRAFSQAARRVPDARLAVVGENRTWPWQDLAAVCKAAGVAGRVDLHEYVSPGGLADLYRRARCFVFLSEYEGFGLTPLEALANEVPPVLLDTPVAREICGDAALYVQRADLTGTATAIVQVLTDESLRRQILTFSEGVLGRYSWERASRETLAAIEGAAS
ncbi:MAG: glycosyltransferase family 1 protein [Acidobacteriota bacterium]